MCVLAQAQSFAEQEANQLTRWLTAVECPSDHFHIYLDTGRAKTDRSPVVAVSSGVASVTVGPGLSVAMVERDVDSSAFWTLLLFDNIHGVLYHLFSKGPPTLLISF